MGPDSLKKTVTAWLIWASIASISTNVAHGQTQSVEGLLNQSDTIHSLSHYTIAEGELSASLTRLSQLFAIPIVFRPDQVSAHQAPTISGKIPFTQALEQLLRGSGLSYTRSRHGIVIQATPSTLEDDSSRAVLTEIVVEGFRHSLASSREHKRMHPAISDSIAAQDIARFPDLNLAESLQRIPAVAITREAGEGRRIALRGLGPDFTQVQINGMDTLVNNDSPMDSRGQKPRDRGFDFNIFSSDLFRHVGIVKTTAARDSDGGIAGAVYLHTPKPLDVAGRHGSIVVQLGDNTYTEGHSHKLVGLLSNSGDRWGGLVSMSMGQRNTEEQGANTFRWRPLGATNGLQDTIGLPLETRVPRGNRYSVWQSDQSRLGYTAALQFQSDTLQWTTELVGSQLHNNRDEYHIYTRGLGRTPVQLGTTQLINSRIEDGNLVYANYRHGQIAGESRIQQADTDFKQLYTQMDWQFGNRWHLSTYLGRAMADFNMPVSDKVYTEAFSDLSIDYERDRYFGHYRYASDMTLPAHWRMHEIDLEEYYARIEQSQIEIELTLELTAEFKLLGGYSFRRLFNRIARATQYNLLLADWQAFAEAGAPDGITPLDNRIPSTTARTLRAHRNLDWMVLDVNQILNHYNVDPDQAFGDDASSSFSIADSQDRIRESTHALYLQMEWQSHLGQLPWSGNLGLRYYHTDASINFPLQMTPLHRATNYDGMLPSVNSKLELSDQLHLRTSISRSINRPTLNVINRRAVVESNTDGSLIIYAPNVNLKPYISDNLDLAIEYYFQQQSWLTLSVYWKHISDMIVDRPRFTTLQHSGFTDSFADLSPDTALRVIAGENLETTQLSGIELSFNSDLWFLPAPWDQLGIGFNVNVAQGKIQYYDPTNGDPLFKKTLPHLSRHVHTTTLYYENDFWGARVSSSFRDRYISQVATNQLLDEDERGFHATNYVDFFAHWNLPFGSQLTFEAINLTNEREEQYSDSSDLTYNTTTSGTSYYLGFVHQF